MQKKALVFVDYDLLVRHFVLSGAFSELERRYDVKYVFHTDSTSPKQGIYLDVNQLGLKNFTRFEIPRARMGAWDKLYSITALHNQRGTENFKRRRDLMALVRGRKRVLWYQFLSHPLLFPQVRQHFLKKMGTFQPLLDFITAEKPDIIIHPSILAGYFINELLTIAPHLGIPLVVLMNSWDNPSTKAMNTGLPDRLIVWGPQTKAHAIKYMKMPPEHVLEFGAAQFDIYRRPIGMSDAELRRMFKVPLDRPIVLYGGASKGADETEHLLRLDRAIEAGEIPSCHVLYRPHPWRGGLSRNERNFFDLSFRHVTMDPHMESYYRKTADQEYLGFDLADYSVTPKLLHMVSAVISPLSTILLEAVMLGKPILMYYPELHGSSLADRQVSIGLNLPHFADFWNSQGIEVCTQANLLSSACQRLLVDYQHPDVREALMTHARKFVARDGDPYGTRLSNLVEELTSAPGRQID